MAATRHVEQRGHWSSGVGAARLFRGFVIGALLIAVAGFLVGAGPRPATEMPLIETRIKLMKFYPFRLFDAVMPLALAAALAGSVARLVSRGDRSDPVSENRALPALATAAFAAAFLLAVSIPAPDRNPSRMPPKQRADWIDACRWIAANAPQDSIFFTPGETWAFKWYAERPEYVSKKDCPQDASGIVEWNRRLVTIARWSRRHYHPQTGYSREAVRDLHAQTGITHILTGRVGPFPLDPIYENGTYKVFRVPEGQ